jgi:uncharacterized protein (TIGR02099 family)
VTPLRRRLRRLRRGAWLLLSSLLILAALLVGMVNLALPWVASDSARLARWIEQRLGQPVSIAAAGGQWLRSGPAFRLKALRLGGADGIEVDEAELRVNVYAWLLPRRALVELRLSGLELEIDRAADGQWSLKGLSLPQDESGTGAVEQRLPGALSVRDSRLRVRDAGSGLDLMLERVNLSLTRERGREHWNGSLWPRDGSAPIGFVLERAAAASRAYLVGRDLALEEWLGEAAPFGIGLRRGRGAFEAWLEWRGRSLREVRVELDLAGLELRGVTPLDLGGLQIEPRSRIERFAMGARWLPEHGGWRLDAEDLVLAASAEEDLGSRLSLRRSDKVRYRLEVERVALAPVVALAALADAGTPGLRGALYASAASGRAEDLVVEFGDGGLQWLRARVESLATRAHRGVPGIGPLSFELRGDRSALLALIEDQHPLLDAPRLFREPLLLEGLDARLGFHPVAPGGPRLELADARVALGGLDIDLDLALDFGPADGAVLEAAARVAAGRIEQVHGVWPAGLLPPRTLRWLEDALVAGDLAHGAAVFRGPLAAWPFDAHEGRFEAVAEVRDAVLAYNPAWPPVEGLEATARFVNTAMTIDARAGSVAGNRISSGHARIPDLDHAVLDIQVAGRGRGPQLLGLLRRSPLVHRFGSYLIGVEVGGQGDVALDLHFPLKPGLGEDRVAGEVWLRQADLRDAKWGLAFDRATGPVRFDGDGFSADELTVWIGPDPAHLSIAVGGRTGDPAHLAEASLRGWLPLSAVTSGMRELEPLWPRVRGRSRWTLDLAVERDPQGGAGASRLMMESDLVGAQVDLPAPLGKPAEAPLPLRAEMSLPSQGGRLALTLGDLARVDARMPGPGTEFAAGILLGPGEVPAIPESGLYVRGRLAALDLGGWAGMGAGQGLQGPIDVALDVGRLGLLGGTFEEVGLVLRSDAGGSEIALSGPGLAGVVEVPVAPPGGVPRGVTARFERLHWPGGGDGRTRGREMSGVDPAAIPPLHLWVRDLRLGDAQLGETRLETYPRGRGLHVELFESRSPELEVRARGDWLRERAGDRSRFELSFIAQNLGRMLDALGYSGFVEGGQTLAQFNVAWPGSPADFGLANLSGTLDLSIGSGRILEVEPGAGRILGLASLQAIPRRLALDFSDLFAPGMSFNAINGSFRFADGNAWTEDLRLDGPAAAVGIRGRTGLADRSYDQELDVYPRLGGALPVFGAIAGGPAGAAAGLVAQNVFARPLDQVARARYRVTGSWDQPEIEQVPLPRPRARESGSG